MQTVIEHSDLLIPDYALPYLVNGDASGLSDEDQKVIDGYMAQYLEEAKANGGHMVFVVPADCESSFTHRPEFGLACNCAPCTIAILK